MNKIYPLLFLCIITLTCERGWLRNMISSDETTKNNDDTTPPTLTIITPADNSTQSGIVTISVVTNDENGIKHVEFFIDSSLVNTDTESPYQYQWDSFTVQSGTHTIKVISTDSSDNSSEQSVDVIISSSLPTVVITSPLSDSTVSGTITVTVHATAYTDKVINNVEFYINNSLEVDDQEDPYEYALMTNNYEDGVLMIKAIAYDNYGDSASDSLSINILNSVWIMEYSDYQRGESVQQTTDGGYIITGAGAGNNNEIFILKTDSFGNVDWEQTFTSNYTDVGKSVKQTVDGGFVITGFITNEDIIYNVVLIKTDASGNEQWYKSYTSMEYSQGHSVQQTTDGGYIIGGHYLNDLLLLKTDSNGDTTWSRTFDNGDSQESANDFAYSVQQTEDGGYIVAGYINNEVSGGDACLIKLDSNGGTTWFRSFGGSGWDEAQSVQQTDDGGYIIMGTNWNEGLDFWLIKTDASGNEQWNKTFGGNMQENGYSVQQTEDGGYILAGDKYVGFSKDAWLIKTDASGNEQWNKIIGNDNYDDDVRYVQQTIDGGYIFTGKTYHNLELIDCLWLVKTNSEGITVEYP